MHSRTFMRMSSQPIVEDSSIRFSTPAHPFLFFTVQYCPRAYLPLSFLNVLTIGKPFHRKALPLESLSIKHAAPLQDAGVTARRQLEFTTWRAVGWLTQVLEGRGAKRGEMHGASRARAWLWLCSRGGVHLKYFRLTPPLGRALWSLKGAGWLLLKKSMQDLICTTLL